MNGHASKKIVVLAAAILGTTVCQADTITTYSSPTAFAAALAPGALTDTFSSFGAGEYIYTHSDSNGIFGYTASAPNASRPQSPALAGISTTNPPLITTQNSNQPSLFTPNQGNVTAIGGDFYDINGSFNFVEDPVSLTLHYGNGLTDTIDFTPTSLADSYFGFTDTDITTNGYITGLTVNAGQAFGGEYTAISDFTIGTAAAVPEPSALLLGLIAGGCIVISKAHEKHRARMKSSHGRSEMLEAILRSRITMQ